eukprot:COSAG01_NODE_1882_length_8990_cov_9.164323_4_plen_302_part_00
MCALADSSVVRGGCSQPSEGQQPSLRNRSGGVAWYRLVQQPVQQWEGLVRVEMAAVLALPPPPPPPSGHEAEGLSEDEGVPLARATTAPPTPVPVAADLAAAAAAAAEAQSVATANQPYMRGAGSDGNLDSVDAVVAATTAAELQLHARQAERDGLIIAEGPPPLTRQPPTLPPTLSPRSPRLLKRRVGDLAAGITELARQVSVKDEFLCPICFCNELVENSLVLPCHHRFCRECVAGWCASKVRGAWQPPRAVLAWQRSPWLSWLPDQRQHPARHVPGPVVSHHARGGWRGGRHWVPTAD